MMRRNIIAYTLMSTMRLMIIDPMVTMITEMMIARTRMSSPRAATDTPG